MSSILADSGGFSANFRRNRRVGANRTSSGADSADAQAHIFSRENLCPWIRLNFRPPEVWSTTCRGARKQTRLRRKPPTLLRRQIGAVFRTSPPRRTRTRGSRRRSACAYRIPHAPTENSPMVCDSTMTRFGHGDGCPDIWSRECQVVADLVVKPLLAGSSMSVRVGAKHLSRRATTRHEDLGRRLLHRARIAQIHRQERCVCRFQEAVANCWSWSGMVATDTVRYARRCRAPISHDLCRAGRVVMLQICDCFVDRRVGKTAAWGVPNQIVQRMASMRYDTQRDSCVRGLAFSVFIMFVIMVYY